MNQIRIARASQARLEEAAKNILDSVLLYEKTNKILYIKDNNKLVEIGGAGRQETIKAGDNLEFVKDTEFSEEASTLRVVDDVVVKTLSTTADGLGLNWKSQELLYNTTDTRKIYVICKKSSSGEPAILGGSVLETGENLKSEYHFSFTSNGQFWLKGTTSASTDLSFVTLQYNNDIYYGLKSNKIINTSLYFSGYKQIPDTISYKLNITDADFTVLSEYYPNYYPGVVETDLIYVYSTDKLTRARVSSRGIQVEKYDTTNKTWQAAGIFEVDTTGNLIVTNDISQIETAITSQMPQNSVVYHLDNDLLDQNDENSKNLEFVGDGEFFQDSSIYLRNSKAYKGEVKIPIMTEDYSFFTKGDLNTEGAFISTKNGIIEYVESLAKKFNNNSSTDWGLTADQLKIAVDAG